MRRTHLRGHQNILKRLLIHVAGFNLGLVMRKMLGIGTPRRLQGGLAALLRVFGLMRRPLRAFLRAVKAGVGSETGNWSAAGPAPAA